MRWVLAFALAALACPAALAQANDLPPAAGAVLKYILEEDYPESFDDPPRKFNARNVVVADLDGDGQDEVTVHFAPHFRQSPTIVIYRVAQDMKVTRVIEGLAPGPLVPVTGNHLDSHTLGEGIDMVVDGGGSQRMVVDSALGMFGGVVEYSTFMHVDGRIGAGAYIDMSDRPVPGGDETCQTFEFSVLKEIAVGRVSGIDDGIVLAAEVGRQVYLYRMRSFRASGRIDKQVWTVDVAEDFRGLATVSTGALSYLTASGEAKPFAIRCDGVQCAQATE